MQRLVSFLLVFFLMTHIAYSQEGDQITTVLISSMSTPVQLSNLIEDARGNGIYLDIEKIEWNETEDQIKAMDFSVQFQKKDGTLGKKRNQRFKYNDLTEGSLLFLQLGETFPLQVLVDNKMAFDEMKDMLVGDLNKNNRMFTNFSDPIDAQSEAQLNALAMELHSHFRENNELITQIRKERDHGAPRYKYRYYYNGQRLEGSHGISEVDMTCDASIGNDADGKLSLFVNSELKLSPFAVVGN